MTEESGSASNHYYYTGQERDAAPSGLYNLRARYYAPGIGRFTQEDPIWQSTAKRQLLPFWEYNFIYGSCNSTGSCGSGPSRTGPISPQDNNPYAYCIANPINLVDPSGLWHWNRTNWCGSDYNGGIHKPLEDIVSDKDLRKKLKPPNSHLDYCCMNHDFCYMMCREGGGHSLGYCHRVCDSRFVGCLEGNYQPLKLK